MPTLCLVIPCASALFVTCLVCPIFEDDIYFSDMTPPQQDDPGYVVLTVRVTSIDMLFVVVTYLLVQSSKIATIIRALKNIMPSRVANHGTNFHPKSILRHCFVTL